jgi:two-component system, cell cycle response regulator DivK
MMKKDMSTIAAESGKPVARTRERSDVVLVVDDDRDAREMLSEFLEFSGFHVEQAADGARAVSLATDLQPSIVLMDLSMPRMDGWEATRRIKRDEQLKEIPVVAASAHALTSEVKSAFEAGCDGFISKPLDLSLVATTVQRALKDGVAGLPPAIRRLPTS